MKKLLFITLLLTVLFSGCDFDDDDETSFIQPTVPSVKHKWTATTLDVDTPNDKINTLNSVILAGEYSSADFKCVIRDDYYTSEFFAEQDGVEWEKDVSADITVNGKKLSENEKFTVEVGKPYSLSFTYEKLPPVKFDLFGNKDGGLIVQQENFKCIEETSFNEVIGDLRIKLVKLETSTFSGTQVSSTSIYLRNISTDDYTAFVGPDKNNLAKINSDLQSYKFSATDKLLVIYHETGIADAASATTCSFEASLKVSPVSNIANAMIKLKSVTEGAEISLLSLFDSNHNYLTVYDSSYEAKLTDANLGKMNLLDSNGKLRPEFTVEIHATKDFSDAAIATITSETSDEKWTPGAGIEDIDYSLLNSEHVSPVTTYKYFVKVSYDDGHDSFCNSNVYKTDEKGQVYAFLRSAFIVNK